MNELSDGPLFTPLPKLGQLVKKMDSDIMNEDDTHAFAQYFGYGDTRYSNMLKGVKHEKNQDEFEWTTEQIHMLLAFYSEYPQLWDTKHERYMNKEGRKLLIQQLSKKVGAPEHAVNVKFQRLRVHFSRELRKEESSAKANEAHLYQSKWRYYNNMLFLKDTLKCRQKIRQIHHEKDMVAFSDVNTTSVVIPASNTLSAFSAATLSDSGHSSPDSNISPNMNSSPHNNRENVPPPTMILPPSSPSIIRPTVLPPASLIPPSSLPLPSLLNNYNMFCTIPSTMHQPPVSLLNSIATLEQLFKPQSSAIRPIMFNKGKGDLPNLSLPLVPQSNASAVPLSPLTPLTPRTPNITNSFSNVWNSPHVLTSRETARQQTHSEDNPQNQAKRVKNEVIEHRDSVERKTSESISDCDYFAMNVSESLRRMDIVVREECKMAIQNALYQYIVKSTQREDTRS